MASFVQHARSCSRLHLHLHLHLNLRPLPEVLVSVLLAVSCPPRDYFNWSPRNDVLCPVRQVSVRVYRFVAFGRRRVCILHSTSYCVLSLLLLAAKRQTSITGSAFNGAFGVDSQDILNAPDIDFGTFQLFPDQTNYGFTGTEVQPPSADFNCTVDQTTTWIRAHAHSVHT